MEDLKTERQVENKDKTLKMTLPVYYHWHPQSDITTYELALCIPILVFPVQGYSGVDIRKLPREVWRHFKEMMSEPPLT